MKLFYVILGATPPGRNTEQHDIFFGIAPSLKDLIPDMKKFWPEANGKIHIDGYQEVRFVDGFEVNIVANNNENSPNNLFFVNLGGYEKGHFEELHQKFLMVDEKLSKIIRRVKKTDFYKTKGFPEAESHIDDQYGVDIDDIFKVEDILPLKMKEKFSLQLVKSDIENQENVTFVGYLSLKKLIKLN